MIGSPMRCHLGVVHRVDGADDAAAQRRFLELRLILAATAPDPPASRSSWRWSVAQAREIPFLVADVRRQVLVEDAADDLGADAADRVGQVGRRP